MRKLLDFLHKSKQHSGFLGKTKPSRATYMAAAEERRQVLTTKLSTSSTPTRSTYVGSLLLIAIINTVIGIPTLSFAAGDQFYLKAQAGTSKINATKDKLFNIKIKSKPIGIFGFGAGWHITENIRTDVTLDFLAKPQLKKSFNKGGIASSIKHRGQVSSLLVNGYVDVFNLTIVKFFGGAGFGWAQVKEKVQSYVGAAKKVEGTTKTANNFAYQLTVGAATEVIGGVAVELSYSWRDYGQTKKLQSEQKIGKTAYKAHNMMIGFRFDI
ncbi:outer membrane protein [Candidatus Tisiphia endosymbiont of Beris chalybata]|uniref:outer membrane protein n=1 Tax=Candidatus Tisiphia endosymbiont of Beris chalybata TaxID=3066262 RepID=UPI00312CC05F